MAGLIMKDILEIIKEAKEAALEFDQKESNLLKLLQGKEAKRIQDEQNFLENSIEKSIPPEIRNLFGKIIFSIEMPSNDVVAKIKFGDIKIKFKTDSKGENSIWVYHHVPYGEYGLANSVDSLWNGILVAIGKDEATADFDFTEREL